MIFLYYRRKNIIIPIKSCFTIPNVIELDQLLNTDNLSEFTNILLNKCWNAVIKQINHEYALQYSKIQIV